MSGATPERLSAATLRKVPAGVAVPQYDRARMRPGVLHFGPGAFHRAHQAFYFDRMLHGDPGFGVCAVSLRSPDVRDALASQDGLYTLVEREAEPSFRIIGAVASILCAPAEPVAVWRGLTAPELRIVSATVTEKGYALTTAGELDLEHPGIRADLARPETPASFVGWLVEGLGRRRALGLAPPVVISCDNLSDNGRMLGRACAALAGARGDSDLAAWIEDEVAFPNSMVDAITPATDEALRADVERELGLRDAWPVQRERFVQWVVEDRLGADAEAFAGAGVTLARNVAPFERAKIRLLNGAHSTLAYVGLGLGYETVAQAMADPALARFVERMMREDIAPTVQASGIDVSGYIADVLARFRNPAIVHQLSQIAWDGSQKLRFRILETLTERLATGAPIARLTVPIAAWIQFVRRQAAAGAPLVDPLARELCALTEVDDFLALQGVFPPALSADPRVRAAVADTVLAIQMDPRAALG